MELVLLNLKNLVIHHLITMIQKMIILIMEQLHLQLVVILEQDETPGLGANAEKESFRDQFKQAVPENGFTVTKSTAGEGEISAMTGATITTTAVTNAVNDAIAQYNEIKEGA